MSPLQWLLHALAALKARYQDPDPIADKALFDAAWSNDGALDTTSDRFLNGQEPYQFVMTDQLFHDLEKARGGLGAIGREAANYLTAYSLLLVAASLAVADKIGVLRGSPYRWVVWLFAAILILLLRSHASRLSSWWDNREGAGAKASRTTTRYAFVNNIREDILKLNRLRQRAERMLAFVHVLVVAIILVGCVVLVK